MLTLNAERERTLVRIAEVVAAKFTAATGRAWAVLRDGLWAYDLRCQTGAAVSVYYTDDNRVRFRGAEYPQSKDGRYFPLKSVGIDPDPPAVTVSPDRPPERIADDVWRRLGEVYVRRHAAAVVERDEFDRMIDVRDAARTAVRDEFGLREHGNNLYGQVGGVRVEFRISETGSVEFDRCYMDHVGQLRAVLAALRVAPGKKTDDS